MHGPYYSDAKIDVIDFAKQVEKPVAPITSHTQGDGPADALTVAQLQAQLSAAGIDVKKALTDVLPLLTPDESKRFGDTLTADSPAVFLLRRRRLGFHRAQDRR